MAEFNFMDLLDPRKIFANLPWLAAGAIAGVVVYQYWMGNVVQAHTYPSLNVGAYGPQPVQTKTYGCAECGQTSGIAVMSPSNETPKF